MKQITSAVRRAERGFLRSRKFASTFTSCSCTRALLCSYVQVLVFCNCVNHRAWSARWRIPPTRRRVCQQARPQLSRNQPLALNRDKSRLRASSRSELLKDRKPRFRCNRPFLPYRNRSMALPRGLPPRKLREGPAKVLPQHQAVMPLSVRSQKSQFGR